MISNQVKLVMYRAGGALLLGIGLYFAFNNHLHDDDFILLKEVQEKGVMGSVQHFYQHWSTRWIAMFISNAALSIQFLHTYPGLFNLLTLSLLYGSMYSFLKHWAEQEEKKSLWLKSIYWSAALMACTYHLHDTWFWVTTSPMYGWPLIASIAAFAQFGRRPNYLNIILLLIYGLMVGGGAEMLAISLLLATPVVLFYNRSKSWFNTESILYFTAGLALAFGIAMMGEGSQARAALLPSPDLFTTAKRSAGFVFQLITINSPVHLLAALLLLHESWFAKKIQVNQTDKLVPICLFWMALVCINCFILVKLMGEAGPMRAWNAIGLGMWLGLVILFRENSSNSD